MPFAVEIKNNILTVVLYGCNTTPSRAMQYRCQSTTLPKVFLHYFLTKSKFCETFVYKSMSFILRPEIRKCVAILTCDRIVKITRTCAPRYRDPWFWYLPFKVGTRYFTVSWGATMVSRNGLYDTYDNQKKFKHIY